MVKDEEEDPLSKLIKRAEIFRQSLIDASTNGGSFSQRLRDSDLQSILSKDRRSPTFDKLLDTLLLTEGEDEDADADANKFLVSDRNTDVVEEDNDPDEAALLQELFFSEKKQQTTGFPVSRCVASGDENVKPARVYSGCLQLLVTIGKLVLSGPTLRDLTKTKASFLGNTSSVLPNCTCLLTLLFPALFDVKGVKLCPEQQISVEPVRTERRLLHFDYKTQLFWKLAGGRPQDEWWRQVVKTTVYFRWHSGATLKCYGYLSLRDAVGSAPGGFHTSLVLVGDKTVEENLVRDDIRHFQQESGKISERSKKKMTDVGKPCTFPDTEGRPVATIDIRMELIGEPESSKQQKEEERPWVYLDLHNTVDFVSSLEHQTPNSSVLLVIKSGSTHTYRSISSKKGSSRHHKYLDAVLQPWAEADGLIFLEIWRSWRAYEAVAEEGGLEDLVGMVRIPYSLDTWKQRKCRQGTVRFSGKFKVWHPNKSSMGGRVAISVVLGLRYQVLRMQAENQAAALIQFSVREYLRRRHHQTNFKDEFESSTTKSYILSDVILWHTFEVNVQKLTGLPDADALPEPGKVFIKYVFPGEQDPLYTSESEWLQTIVFEASVQHRISLPQEASLISYMKDLDPKCEGLRFEIWQARSGEEQHLGSSYLSHDSLLLLLKPENNHKVKRLFRLPISNQANCLRLETKLVVEVGYHRLDFSEQLLRGTIFAANPSRFPAPVDAILQVDIIRAKGLQEAAVNPFQGRLNSYVRFSLFPSNQTLEVLYPPSLTPFRADSVCPLYGFSTSLVLTLTAGVVEELKNSKMRFDIWHHSPTARTNSSLISRTSLVTDTWLATATAPCSTLLTSRRGINGWLNLVSRRGEAVGKLEVDVKFVNWKRLD